MQGIRLLLAPRVLLVLAIIYSLVLTAVSIVETNQLPSIRLFPMQDKLAHLLAYIILSVLWGGFWLRTRAPRYWKPYLPVLLLTGLIYGIIIELTQHMITQSRSADVYDVLANTLGMLIGATAIYYLMIKVGLNSKV